MAIEEEKFSPISGLEKVPYHLHDGVNNSLISSSNKARARYYSGSAQTIADNTPTTVAYDTKTYDTDNAFDTTTHIFTCPRTGYYNVNASVQWAANAAGDNYVIYIYLNTTAYGGFSGFAEKAGTATIEATDTLKATAGDTIYAKFTHTAGVSKDINADSARTHITINEL